MGIISSSRQETMARLMSDLFRTKKLLHTSNCPVLRTPWPGQHGIGRLGDEGREEACHEALDEQHEVVQRWCTEAGDDAEHEVQEVVEHNELRRVVEHHAAQERHVPCVQRMEAGLRPLRCLRLRGGVWAGCTIVLKVRRTIGSFMPKNDHFPQNVSQWVNYHFPPSHPPQNFHKKVIN